jgi:hypothetical protein
MNKALRDKPPEEERRFADEEIALMKPALLRRLRDKTLVEVNP